MVSAIKTLNPISNTAYYCCGVRMLDAESSRPVCGDTYAKIFMNEIGMQIFEPFKTEDNPNASNVARHRIIDDLIRDQLLYQPNSQIVIIGAGFDSRAYRIEGGSWVELDEPQIIDYKNERLPISQCNNPLQRIPIEFVHQSIGDKLAPFAGDRSTVVLIEGVFMHLPQSAIRELLRTLKRLFASQTLICDLMTRRFFEKYSHTFHEKLADLGSTFIIVDKPDTIFLENGYQVLSKISVIGRALQLGILRIPRLMFHLFLHRLSRGYSIYVFKPD